MRLNLYEDSNNSDEHVDIFFTNMRPAIRQMIDIVNSDRPSLSGRPADEDLDDGVDVILDPKDIYYLDHVERNLSSYTNN